MVGATTACWGGLLPVGPAPQLWLCPPLHWTLVRRGGHAALSWSPEQWCSTEGRVASLSSCFVYWGEAAFHCLAVTQRLTGLEKGSSSGAEAAPALDRGPSAGPTSWLQLPVPSFLSAHSGPQPPGLLLPLRLLPVAGPVSRVGCLMRAPLAPGPAGPAAVCLSPGCPYL